jgi:hypothetical protein
MGPRKYLSLFFTLIPLAVSSQESFQSGIENHINGFVRSGIYAGQDKNDGNKFDVSSFFSDFSIKATAGNGINFWLRQICVSGSDLCSGAR